MATTFPVPSPWLQVADLTDATEAYARTTAALNDLYAFLLAQTAKLPLASSNGGVSITPVANVPTSGLVAFPPGLFTTAPTVVCGPFTQYPGQIVLGAGWTSVTPAGCTVWVYRTDTFPTQVNWLAVQDL